MNSKDEKKLIKDVTSRSYQYGFVSKLESDTISKGLTEETVKLISQKKGEPSWMLQKRLDALALLKTMSPPKWANLKFEEMFQLHYTNMATQPWCPAWYTGERRGHRGSNSRQVKFFSILFGLVYFFFLRF